MPPVALTIAGSDPSGGAGIQADLKTFHQFGVYGEAVITLLTVQNTRRVSRVEVLAADLVAEQTAAVLEDIPPAAAKTGALGAPAVIEAVARVWAPTGIPLVVDPVLLSTHGASLAGGDARQAILRHLLPLATLVTPNLPEAAALTGLTVDSPRAMEEAARHLAGLGAAAVLLKGGHLAGDPVDLLFTADGSTWLPAPRIGTRHTHGTGCTYAAAITALLARGHKLEDAVTRARAYVQEAIATNPGLGAGSGPLNHWAGHGVEGKA